MLANSLLNKLNQKISEKIDYAGASPFAFGIFGVLNYPASFLFWRYSDNHAYENLTLRLIATFLCLFLVLKKYWPKAAQIYFPLYWYFTLLFTLPFFGAYMLLHNQISPAWTMNALLGIYLFVLLVEWFSFLWLFLLGTALGVLFFVMTGGKFSDISVGAWQNAGYMYLFALGIGTLFSRNSGLIHAKRTKTIGLLPASIAHELRTPLTSIDSRCHSLARNYPTLLVAYNAAVAANLPIKQIDPEVLTALPQFLSEIQSETDAAQSFIDMLLINVKQHQLDSDKEAASCSMTACINMALERYPFRGTQRERVIFEQPTEDFLFRGNELLMVHVFFNLIKNSLYHIAATEYNTGNITIRIHKTDKRNAVSFKDTGVGIARKDLPHIFERFYSRTRHGSGIGLAFCKMIIKGFGGQISCASVQGQYTEFLMTFSGC